MNPIVNIVQFPHPGKEHGRDTKNGSRKSWNVCRRNGRDVGHARKFLLSPGVYIEDDKAGRGDLVFWGEWEPPSGVVRIPKDGPFHPGYLHTPYYTFPPGYPPAGQGRLQNTDPFVFGGKFRYGLCKQGGRNKSALAALEKGSLILFGSYKEDNKSPVFQLDTVFVIAGYKEYPIQNPAELAGEGVWYKLVIEAAFPRPAANPPLVFRLYYGATYEKPYDGMYSFSPARLYKETNPGFPRVTLGAKECERFSGNYINPALKQGKKISAAAPAEIKTFWEQIRAISRTQGCVEGVRFAMPKERK
ncbi:MAG: hypothetical protein LBQ61_00405 [Spirochaetales bacterium]|jgi:hypothetical protein|nr:hypothetical protein [Spirochaetales bacterium]